jgi:hypothetical protein
LKNQNLQERYSNYQNQIDGTWRNNVQKVFHGTKRSINCNINISGTLCRNSDCSVCCISVTGNYPKYYFLNFLGFKVSKSGTNISFARFGRGIYFAPNSSKANDYNIATIRSMFVCNVLAGKEYHSTDNMTNLTAPPSGYHSVRGITGGVLNYPELVVYEDNAIDLTHLILYTAP